MIGKHVERRLGPAPARTAPQPPSVPALAAPVHGSASGQPASTRSLQPACSCTPARPARATNERRCEPTSWDSHCGLQLRSSIQPRSCEPVNHRTGLQVRDLGLLRPPCHQLQQHSRERREPVGGQHLRTRPSDDRGGLSVFDAATGRRARTGPSARTAGSRQSIAVAACQASRGSDRSMNNVVSGSRPALGTGSVSKTARGKAGLYGAKAQ